MENKEQINVINDLILINADRVVGYEKAMEQLKEEDGELKTIFGQRKDESVEFHKALRAKLPAGEMEHGTTNMGKIYRVWMDVKAFVMGQDRKAILNSCEFGEDAALAAYKNALLTEELDIDVRAMIVKQQEQLQKAHDLIKALREVE